MNNFLSTSHIALTLHSMESIFDKESKSRIFLVCVCVGGGGGGGGVQRRVKYSCGHVSQGIC